MIVQPLLPQHRWTIVDLVRTQAERYGNRLFAHFPEDDRSLTYGELHESSNVVASGLARLGVAPGDRVLCFGSNSATFMELMVGTHKRRAVFAPINTELRGAFLDHQLRNSEPGVAVIDAEFVDRFRALDTDAAGLAHVIVVGSAPDDVASTPLGNASMQTWHQFMSDTVADAGDVLEPEVSDIATIMYTSGTTGPAKGVLMPQGHNYLFGQAAASACGLTEDDHFYTCMPMFHANALYMQLWAVHVAGGSVTVVRRFSTSNWLDDVIECGATITNALGVMPEFIYRSPPTERDRAHKLTRVLALPVADEWGAAFEERFGVRILQGFGMTEINMVAYTDLSDPVMSGCAGRVLDEFFEVIVADPETDLPVAAGEVGEILVRPKRPFCFNAGYFRMPERTVEAWRNLWFHTGDAGRFDPDGRLFYVDRLKDRMRRRGENISSYEVEQVVNGFAGVVESAVVGIKVEGAGGEEEVKVVLVFDPAVGGEFDPVALLEHCVPNMPRFAIPRFIEVTDELDKTASGKIRKQALREVGINAATWDRDSVGWVPPR